MKRFWKRSLPGFAIIFLATVVFAQNDEITPNENLVAEGIPKIPGPSFPWGYSAASPGAVTAGKSR
jgi:hypothetical protein